MGPFKIGWRTMKTVIGVFVTLLLYHWLDREPAALAALACVFAMQVDVPTSIQFGGYRILGNALGAIIAGLVVQAELMMGFTNPYVHIISITLGVLLLIITCNALRISKSIVNSSATFFVVLLTIPTSDLVFYTVNRVLDAIIGVSIAITINRIFPHKIPTPPVNEDKKTNTNPPRIHP